jgi:peptide/nickel transport system substrate-binding protein
MHASRLVLVLAATLVGAPFGLGIVTVSDGQPRREVRIGIGGVPATLDPAAALEGATPLIARQVFDTLVSYRELSTDIEPALATRWGVSRDGLVWTFVLRENVKFHDGTVLTASDVVASFDRHLHPDETAATASAVWGPLLRGVPGVVKEVRAVDARTVAIVLRQPYAPLLSVLAHPGFGVVRRVTGDPLPTLAGTGPYRVAELGSGRVALEAVGGHWSGPPRSERLVFVNVASDGEGEAELEARALDVWFCAAAPRRAEGALSVPGLRVGYLAFQTEREPFARAAVRHAVAAAIEPGTIARTVEGWAVPLQSFLPLGVWGRREGSPITGAGREAAKRLLATGGWPKGGKPTLLAVTSAESPETLKVAEALQQMLAAADVPLNLRVEPPATARALLQSGEYGIALLEATATSGEPHLFLYPLSASEVTRKGARTRLDDMLIRASQLAFRPERARLYQRAQGILATDLPWIPLYTRMIWAAVRPEVHGLRLHPTGFHRLTSLTLDPSGQQP